MLDAAYGDNPFDPATLNLEPETYSLERVIEQATKNLSLELRVALPARVMRQVGERTVDLQPLFKTCFVGRPAEDMAQLKNVPVLMPQGGDWRISFPIAPGDTGLCVFCDRNLDTFLASDAQAPVDPLDSRAHALADAVFIPGLLPATKESTDVGTDLVLTNGKTELRLRKDGTLSVNNKTAEILDILDKIIQQQIALAGQLQSAMVLTAFGPAPFLQNSVAAFLQTQNTLQSLRSQFDTFKT